MSASSLKNGSTVHVDALDLTHHFSKSTKKRLPNVLKEYYKYLRDPEIGNLAGGLPCAKNFPFERLELLPVGPSSLFPRSTSPPVPNISIERISKSSNAVRSIDLNTALQYGGAQGFPPLRAWLRKLARTVYHPNVPYKGGPDILINGGSADGLSKVYEMLFDNWDSDVNDLSERSGLIVEEFVYTPPVSQIKSKDVNIVPVRMDAQGMLAHGSGSLSDVLEKWDYANGKRPHAIYLIPTGQNPTGAVLSLARRREIYSIASRFDLVIIEDDPYWNLYYPSAQTASAKHRETTLLPDFPDNVHHKYSTDSLGGKSTGFQFLDELVPSFLSIDTDGRVIRLDSFSKTIAPGCRLGWFTAQPKVCEQLFRITDCSTQQPSGFTQAIVTKLIADFEKPDSGLCGGEDATIWGLQGWVTWLEGLRITHERRMITMATIFEENRFTTIKGARNEIYTFDWPMGGMFLWLRVNASSHPLAKAVDLHRLMLALWLFCTQRPYLILTVPGGDFAANESVRKESGLGLFRFCFAAVDESLLKAKSYAFVQATRDFWAIDDEAQIDGIIQTHNAAQPSGGHEDEHDREVLREWDDVVDPA